LQTHFKEKQIIITFDEWITLKDVYRQLVISPLMPKEPDIKQKGKAILITLPDSLSDETTYTINFGNAIADLNEGNILENFAFVFSTGAVLDSIRISGMVTDAVMLKPAEGIWVMLYPVREDSAVYKRKPEYVGKTNKDGLWSMSNVRVDSFDVVALKDDNLNFLYDQDAELIGWLEESVYTSDPVMKLPEIFVFPKEKKISIKEITHHLPGWIKVMIESPPPKPLPVFTPPIEQSQTAWTGDTLHTWYSSQQNYSGLVVLNEDTTQVRPSPANPLTNSKLKIVAKSGRMHPGSSAYYVIDVPVASIDETKMTLTNDSLIAIPFSISLDSLDIRRMAVKASWEGDSKYTLTFLPGAVTDYWGRTHDTIRQSILINPTDQFGDLTIDVNGLDSTQHYVLLLKSGEQILDRFVMDSVAQAQFKKQAMVPGKYILEMIEDRNRNGVWDSGDYHLRRPPERKMRFNLDNLRAGWEVDTEILWQ
jgi:hypothetical protein